MKTRLLLQHHLLVSEAETVKEPMCYIKKDDNFYEEGNINLSISIILLVITEYPVDTTVQPIYDDIKEFPFTDEWFQYKPRSKYLN